MCKLKCILCCLAFFALNCYKAKAQHSSDILWYKKSAINFNEALPVGNGRMGAMIYGRVRDEYISLNESTLWSGDPDIKWNNPDAKKYLPLVREAALKGEYKKADSLCKFMQGPYTESYMPMADLFIRYHGITDSLNYKRTLNLDSAIAATILITSATSFNGFNNSPVTDGKDASLIGEANMHKASVKSYTTLLKNHIKDYKSIYERVDYDFGLSPNNNLPTDERLKKMPEQFDANLLALICQYGRYILIASSKPGGQPSNLKGLRNEKLRPEYSSNWCIDHDAQMSYYPVETNNLSELHQPFLQLIKELSENGYQTAGINYGMRGWVAHHNTDIWRKSSPVGNWGEGNPHWANWNMSGAWLCENYFEHLSLYA
jgi:alpha-L-fucosidase 2